MSDAARLLELIEEGIVAHGHDLGGWTKLDQDSLQLFDGRVTLRAEFGEAPDAPGGIVHAHVFIKLHEHDDEELDSCILGMGDDHEAALGQVAGIWIMCVAGPIRSFIDNKPVCMTCQAGVANGDRSHGYVEGDYGLPKLRAYVGPSISRGFPHGEPAPGSLDDRAPWFRHAAESAAPRRVHLAKTTLYFGDKKECRREMEIDGHDVRHVDTEWPGQKSTKGPGYLIRFAVFEFPRNSTEIARRAELERTIRHFAEHYVEFESVDDLMTDMAAKGFDADMIGEVESLSTIAFGRTLFEHMGVEYSPTIIRARRDGRVETEVPLMSLPAYSRGRAVAARLRETMPQEKFQSLCLYNAESHAIVQAIEARGNSGDLSGLRLFPSMVPERGASDETINAAYNELQAMIDRSRSAKKKPWWKFW